MHVYCPWFDHTCFLPPSLTIQGTWPPHDHTRIANARIGYPLFKSLLCRNMITPISTLSQSRVWFAPHLVTFTWSPRSSTTPSLNYHSWDSHYTNLIISTPVHICIYIILLHDPYSLLSSLLIVQSWWYIQGKCLSSNQLVSTYWSDSQPIYRCYQSILRSAP